MAEHVAECNVGSFDVGKVDVVFKVLRNGSVFGRLKVSQGGVEWMRGGKKKYAREMGWEELADLYKAEGHRTKTRSSGR